MNRDEFEITGVTDYLKTLGTKFFVMEMEDSNGTIVVYPISQRDPVIVLQRIDEESDRWSVKFCHDEY